jgi:putative protease
VIVQDLGVIAMIRRQFPTLAVHASTQLSVTDREAVRYLARLGVTRIVPARELSLAEVRDLKSELPVEIETFIHGAMCYCYSGKCLFSSFLGGRSGNRGRCAQPCRQPYCLQDANGKPAGCEKPSAEVYPLSMRDMCTLDLLPELIRAGIDSFKIEGRMKKPEYAAGVTAVYRKYIDRYRELSMQGRASEWKVDREDQETLQDLYLRTERSEGYYKKRNGRDMVTVTRPGYRGSDEKLLQQLREKYIHGVRRVPVRGEVRLCKGERASLSLSAEGPQESVQVFGDTVQQAVSCPLREEDAEKSILKFGNTVFTVDKGDIRILCDEDIFLPVRSLNDLRRSAVSGLEMKRLDGYNRQSDDFLRKRRAAIEETLEKSGAAPARTEHPACTDRQYPEVWAVVLSKEQAEAAESAGADLIADDSACFALEKEDRLLALPYVLRSTDSSYMQDALLKLQSGAYRGALARDISEIGYLREHGYSGTVVSDPAVYCWNRESLEVLEKDCDLVSFPYELTQREMEDCLQNGTACGRVLPAYGRVPMMITANCVKKTGNCCSGREEGFLMLRDRMNSLFPVRTVCSHCGNIIYNSVPLSLHKAAADRVFRQSRAILLAFTTEDAAETGRITQTFCRAARLGTAQEAPVSAYTNGHYRKGTE